MTNINIKSVYTDPVYDEDGNEITPAEFSHYEFVRFGALPRTAKYPDRRTVSGFNLDAFPWVERNECGWYQGDVIGWDVDALTENRLDNPDIVITDPGTVDSGELDENGDPIFVQGEKTATVTFAKEDKLLEECKNNCINSISSQFKAIESTSPRVEVTLTDQSVVYVDGGYIDLNNYLSAQRKGSLELRDADNVRRSVVAGDWDIIIDAVDSNGGALYQSKWDKEDAINAATTAQEVRDAYSA